MDGLTLKWHVVKAEITELLILVPHFSIKLTLRKARSYKRALEADDACLWAR